MRLHLHPLHYFPAQVHSGTAVRFRITDPVMGLEQKGGSQQAGLHSAPAIEGREVLIPKQQPPSNPASRP